MMNFKILHLKYKTLIKSILPYLMNFFVHFTLKISVLFVYSQATLRHPPPLKKPYADDYGIISYSGK